MPCGMYHCHMDTHAPLDDVLKNRTHLRILRALDSLPRGVPASGRELGRRAGVSHPSASSALQELADLSLVLVQRAPRADLYRLNPDHELVSSLRDLLAWEKGFRDRLFANLRELIREEAPWIKRASVFGSAIGPERSAEDLDVALFLSKEKDRDRTAVAAQRIAERIRVRFGVRLDPDRG